MGRAAALAVAGIIFAAVLATGQTPAAPALSLTATTDNVNGAHDSIRINLFRWSTDAERDQLLAAWNLTGASATGGRGRGGRGPGARGGGVPNPAPGDDDPALEGANAAASGRDGGGRGGRGGGRGGEAGAAEANRVTPESSLAVALGKVPTVGYLWSSEVAGYALRYAARLPQQDGGERIVLITDRRLGAWNNQWKPVGPSATDVPATDYEFSLIELHLNSTGEGEGKISLTGKVAVDSAAKTIGLENYSELPAVLKNVRGVRNK
jgi:hypothetical protein